MGFTLKWGDHLLDLDQKTHVMGIVNVTPDSFWDGGRYFGVDEAIDRAREMVREGADIVDVAVAKLHGILEDYDLIYYD